MNITLKTLHEATEQEVFDKVAKHLLAQNKAAKEVNGGCYYRLETIEDTVLKCAVGCLISDNEYKPEIEGDLYGTNSFNNAVGRWFEPSHVPLLRELQNMHDNHLVSEWGEKLREIAESHNLNADILEEFN